MRSNEQASSDNTADTAAIADIVRTFFAAFASGPGRVARLDALRSVFLPDAVIVRTGAGEPAVYGVDSFINQPPEGAAVRRQSGLWMRNLTAPAPELEVT